MKVPFLLLNELIYKSEKTTKKHYDFYATYLKEIISEKESEDYIVMLMLRDYCKLSGLNLEVNKCVECSSNTLKTISFAKHGMLCNACAKKQKENYGLFFSKTIFYLFNDNSEELQKYKDEYRNVIKALTKYIENNSGLKIYSLNEY
jgi:recombinational DNA repair protein (RecF pathway)